MTSVDQVTLRRSRKTGLIGLDKEKHCPGYILYCTAKNGGTAHLQDMQGKCVHEWLLPYNPAFWSYLLPNGHLFSMGRIEEDVLVVTPNWVEKGGILYEMDWSGEIVWEHRDTYQHHDGRRTSSGGAIYLTVEQISDTDAGRVQGGIPDTEEHGMWADVIVEVDSKGSRIWEWHAVEHLDFRTDVLPPNVARHEWSHGNTIVPLDDERVMVSFRHISTVGIIDKKTGDFTWKLGSNVLSGQHDPTMLPNGNVLIYDNGIFRKSMHNTFSRVVEVVPSSNEIAWEYVDTPRNSFYSPFIGGARRLPNGNTLVTEGWFGRLFQVTPENEVVWEYINPHFLQFEHFGSAFYNAIFRTSFYTEEQISAFL